MSAARLLLLPLTVLLASCGGSASHSYFPLDGGAAWEYSVSYMVRGEPRTQRRIISNGPPVELQEQHYYPRLELNGHREYYQKTDAGVVHVDPVSGNKDLILPQQPTKGSQWQGQSYIRVLEVTGAFTATFKARIRQPITVTYTIEDMDDTVTVAAGTFTHCLRVHGEGHLFAGRTLQDMMGMYSINLEQTRWYAPGVGLVKSVRKEFTVPNDFRNTYTLELQSYTRD